MLIGRLLYITQTKICTQLLVKLLLMRFDDSMNLRFTVGPTPCRSDYDYFRKPIVGNFSLGKGMLFWQFLSNKCQNSVIPVKKPKFFYFGPENVKILQLLSRK